MKYVLLFVETEAYARELEEMTPADRDRAYAMVGRWFAEHAGNIRGHSKLQPADAATTLRLDGAQPVVIDGPFVEGKEVVSGVAEIEADDLDEALRIAKAWPGCPIVEIRPVQDVGLPEG